MKITKVSIKNALGIKEVEFEPKQINILQGRKASNKTSFIDALQKALNNKNVRSKFIHKDEKSAELHVEIENGEIVVDRSTNREKSDSIKVRENGSLVSGPETFLKKLFTIEQFNPLSFVALDEKEQNKILLSLVDIEWSKDNFVEWFGQVPKDIDLNNHILSILDYLGGINSDWYKSREEINRIRRQKEAIRDEDLQQLPSGYQVEDWRDADLSKLYGELSIAEETNRFINNCKDVLSNFDIKKSNILADKEAAISTKRYEYSNKKQEIKDIIISDKEVIENSKIIIDKAIDDARKGKADIDIWLKEEVEKLTRIAEKKKIALDDVVLDVTSNQDKIAKDKRVKISQKEQELKGLDDLLNQEIITLEEICKSNIEKEEIKIGKAQEYINSNDLIDVKVILEKAEHAEKMKTFITTYDKAMSYNGVIQDLKIESDEYTALIEKARYLPGELLQTANVPISGLSVKDGQVLINDLPIDNLSDGEKMELSVEIAKHKAGDLKVVFLDKFESLDSASREEFLKLCLESDLQFFITLVADGELEILTLDKEDF